MYGWLLRSGIPSSVLARTNFEGHLSLLGLDEREVKKNVNNPVLTSQLGFAFVYNTGYIQKFLKCIGKSTSNSWELFVCIQGIDSRLSFYFF